MTTDDRVSVLERQMAVLSSFTKEVARDIARLAADKNDVQLLQAQIDNLSMQVSLLSCELQAIRQVAE